MEQPINPYAALIDEYAAGSYAEAMVATIVSTHSCELEPHKNADVDVKTATLLSTQRGRREWIRRELLKREPKFTSRRTLRIFATTWNVAGGKPTVGTDALGAWLWNTVNRESVPDVFIIGLQEVQPLSGLSIVSTDITRGAAWKESFEAVLKEDYVSIREKQMIGIYLMVIVRKEHAGFVQNVAITEAGIGFMRMGGNKGGVSCRFTIYDKSVCAVSAHLSAHDYNVDRRNQDFHDIVRKSTFSLSNPAVSPFDYRESHLMCTASLFGECYYNSTESRYSTASPTDKNNLVLLDLFDHDVVVWVGDLNYRLDGLDGEKVCSLIKEGKWNFLAQHDQLTKAFKEGKVFAGFEEIPLNFAPTYKYEPDRDAYNRKEEDRTLKRTPAWTDRILWRVRPESKGLKVSEYRRHEIFSSDHRPVSAVFDMAVSTVNIQKRNNAVQGIHRSMRKYQEFARPKLTLSTSVIDLGLVPFGVRITGQTPLVVRNVGNLPVEIRIGDEQLPPWLTAKSNIGNNNDDNGQGGIAPGEESEFYFTAFMGLLTGFTRKFSIGDDISVTGIPILVQNVPVAYVSVNAGYQPMSFGSNSDIPLNPERFYLPPIPKSLFGIGMPRKMHALLLSYVTFSFLFLCILLRVIKIAKPVLARIIAAPEYTVQRNLFFDVLRPIISVIYDRCVPD